MIRLSRRSLLAGAAAALVPVVSIAAWADGGAAPGPSAPSPGNLDAVLAEIARARSSLKTLTGPFIQERTIGLLKSKIRSAGTLTLVRPDRMRWELAPPDEITYWVTAESVAYAGRSGHGSVRSGATKLAAALDDLRTLLGGDLTLLTKRYELSLIKRDAQEVAFEAVPRADAGVKLERLAFALAPDLVRPLRATLVEGPKDKTEITFGTLARDVPVDPAKMVPP